MTKEIILSRGLVALVDDADYGWLMTGGKWNARGRPGNYYAARTIWEGKKCRGQVMHRLLLPTPGQVDHINGDSLDNRRANLRPASPSQNAANRKARSDSKSGYKGLHRVGRKWQVSLTVHGRFVQVGMFRDKEEAARAYDAAALEHFGEFARLNFPRDEVA